MRNFDDGSLVSLARPRFSTVDFQPRPRSQADQPALPARWTRKWYQTPWKQRNFLDAALRENVTDTGGDTSWTDVLNNLVSQAGNVLVARNAPGAMVPRPVPGQVVPGPAVPRTAAQSLGLGISTNTLLIGGAVIAGLLIIPKLMKRR